ncbi:DNA-formamidopyrimidine glycosylase [Bacilli bacterium]|uniref:DNA-formamidopyrimidine glycosylase n=1 Tax=Oceanobacillus caeni TaxID=405946 RepID=UPI0006213293|nr:DNA-formamidopyrimidine glycosylase [Oceanobacillus caeni]KKE79038.1 5-hydroxymethyluracil DNA glycosylase [Bacilli bacterium VT-13-104]PZD86271.1 DNA-formamidopyrimidine glycosylase [Bacilli bacterium]MBU8789616.1 DNA-formamidopyrimidine glycosylase [Oceanobacillus caeni]PZD87118.1 DNA-formamidopyrimidine glycosylase [Bacilli bacterium]PZD90345.1 DNA-formamidopyrimidine glycosylase [Bacilli bacterium]
MPELPEVETIRKTLIPLVSNKTIDKVEVYWPKMVKVPDDVERFKLLLQGQTIQRMGRRGKFLLFYLNDVVLISHLRMEGKYGVVSSAEPIEKHTHVIFTFTNGEDLRYNDVRKFGTMHVYPIGQEFESEPLKKLGPEPFDEGFTLDYLYQKLKRTERPIKAVLLDQTVVTGLGNIYVDETLFRAKIHPSKKASHLTKKEVERIRDESIHTLADAVKQGGTTIRSYVNGQGEMGMFQQELFVYGQENKECKRCGNLILKTKVAGRGTHICPNCQKE